MSGLTRLWNHTVFGLPNLPASKPSSITSGTVNSAHLNMLARNCARDAITFILIPCGDSPNVVIPALETQRNALPCPVPQREWLRASDFSPLAGVARVNRARMRQNCVEPCLTAFLGLHRQNKLF